jgi:hypothetical protein
MSFFIMPFYCLRAPNGEYTRCFYTTERDARSGAGTKYCRQKERMQYEVVQRMPEMGIGKVIKKIEIDNIVLLITFEDYSVLTVWDDKQTCCEERYMSTDDDLSYQIGAVFMGLEVLPTEDDPDVQFMHLRTNRSVVVCTSYTDCGESGYYTGFDIRGEYYPKEFAPTKDTWVWFDEHEEEKPWRVNFWCGPGEDDFDTGPSYEYPGYAVWAAERYHKHGSFPENDRP